MPTQKPSVNRIYTLRPETMRDMLFLIFLLGSALNIATSAPIKLLEPYDIEISCLEINPTTPDQLTSSTQFLGTITATITKLISPPQHYQIVYGYRVSSLSLDSVPGTLTTRIQGPSNGNTKLGTTFQFKYHHYEQTSINSIWINYMLIGKALHDTLLIRNYYFKIGLPDPTCNGFASATTCTYIKPISLAHLNYKTYVSMTGITYTKNTTPITNLLKFDLTISLITRSTLSLNLQAEFLNIVTFEFYFLAIDHQVFDLSNLTSNLMVQHLSNLTAAATYLHYFPQTINPANYFIGISKYQGDKILLTDLTFTIAFPVLQKRVSGWLSLFCKGLNIFVLAMYGYAPSCTLYRNCLLCYVRPDLFCTQCKENFNLVPLPNGNNDCQCQAPLQLVSGICDTIPFGCTIAQRLPDKSIRCHLCDPMKFLKLKPSINSCECYQNYFMDANQTCQDYCGDGIIMQSQCDDGNQVSGDGCSSTCDLESGFTCDTSVQPTKCKSSLMLLYRIESILKNSKSNSAVIKLQLRNPSIYNFPVFKNQFEPVSSHIKLKIILSRHPYVEVPLHDLTLLSINEENEIEIQFSFPYTIEETEGILELNYQFTNYANYTQPLDFPMVGDNSPLKFEDKVGTYQKIGIGMLITTIFDVLFLFMGIITPKFIGLESVLALQLCFFSQILVHDNKKFPIGFLSLENLQYSAGFNRIFDLTEYIPITYDSIKMNHIKREKFVIENFNINFFILLLSLICLAISFILRTRNERMVELNKGIGIKKSKNDASELPKQIPLLKKVNDLMFFLANQVAFWLFLPLLSAVTAKLQIDDFTVTTDLLESNFTIEVAISNVISVLGFFIILSIVLNNFSNIWLSYKTVRLQHERPEEVAYKRILFIYLLVVGSLVFFANHVYFYHVYCSSIVLGLHLIFMVIIIVLNPYKYSLKVHTIGMVINNAIYLTFLIVVNFINYLDSIHHDISLLLGYTMLGLSGLSIILTIIRLYYELRYGRKLEDKLAEEKLKKQHQQKIRRAQELKKKRAQMESEANRKLSQLEKKRNFNFYLYENQVKEDRQKELIEWLQNRNILDQKTKEQRYFEKFAEKPLPWYKKNEPQKYYQRMQQISDHFKDDKERDQRKKDDENYHLISSKLRKQISSAKRRKEQDLYRNQKKLRTMPNYAMEVMKKGEEKYMHKAYDLKD